MALWIIGATVVGVGAVGVAWYIGTFNTLVTARQDLKTQWSNIKTEYQRRADLIGNLVATVKSFKKHEKETLLEVAKARGGNFGKTKAEEVGKMKFVDTMLQRLMVVVEAYPDLKANEQHNQLMTELRVTEDRINIARTDYNSTVRDYNILVQRFPSSIVAKRNDFAVETFFELVSPDADKAPKVEF